MATKLDLFLYSRRIKTVDVARSSGFSRQHLFGVRNGTIDPTRRCIAAIALACRRLSGEPVQAAELFELDVEAGEKAQAGSEISTRGGRSPEDSWSRR